MNVLKCYFTYAPPVVYRKMVITIQIWFGLTKFRKYSSVCISQNILHNKSAALQRPSARKQENYNAKLQRQITTPNYNGKLQRKIITLNYNVKLQH